MFYGRKWGNVQKKDVKREKNKGKGSNSLAS